jgi:DNA-binding NarL/FixJ family response regulator
MEFTHNSAGGDMKIFIVEDSPAVLERLVDMVTEVRGTELVGNAGNFRDAVTGIISARPEVAILDIRLADDHGTGIDVLNRVKPQLPWLRAIVLSNYATPQHIKASADAGAEYFLDKSADFERITEILRKLQEEGDANPTSHP